MEASSADRLQQEKPLLTQKDTHVRTFSFL